MQPLRNNRAKWCVHTSISVPLRWFQQLSSAEIIEDLLFDLSFEGSSYRQTAFNECTNRKPDFVAPFDMQRISKWRQHVSKEARWQLKPPFLVDKWLTKVGGLSNSYWKLGLHKRFYASEAGMKRKCNIDYWGIEKNWMFRNPHSNRNYTNNMLTTDSRVRKTIHFRHPIPIIAKSCEPGMNPVAIFSHLYYTCATTVFNRVSYGAHGRLIIMQASCRYQAVTVTTSCEHRADIHIHINIYLLTNTNI